MPKHISGRGTQQQSSNNGPQESTSLSISP
jgi:hypothetical protein